MDQQTDTEPAIAAGPPKKQVDYGRLGDLAALGALAVIVPLTALSAWMNFQVYDQRRLLIAEVQQLRERVALTEGQLLVRTTPQQPPVECR